MRSLIYVFLLDQIYAANREYVWQENKLPVKNVAGDLLTFPHAVWIDIPRDLAIIMLLILCLPTFIISTVM